MEPRKSRDYRITRIVTNRHSAGRSGRLPCLFANKQPAATRSEWTMVVQPRQPGATRAHNADQRVAEVDAVSHVKYEINIVFFG